jgi:hypothetical protein
MSLHLPLTYDDRMFLWRAVGLLAENAEKGCTQRFGACDSSAFSSPEGPPLADRVREVAV